MDNEHEVQIGMLDAFCALVEQGEPKPLIHEMLDQLISYSDIHFMSEQLLMRMYAYPDYDDHVNDHQAMIEHLNKIKQRFETGQENMALDIAHEMRKFLLGHIGNRDAAFTSYLLNTKAT